MTISGSLEQGSGKALGLFAPSEFHRFWTEVSSKRRHYQLYKLLVRYNPKSADIHTPYHGTFGIDVTIPGTRRMLDLSAELFSKYTPLEHQGKYSIERWMAQRN